MWLRSEEEKVEEKGGPEKPGGGGFKNWMFSSTFIEVPAMIRSVPAYETEHTAVHGRH